MPQPQPPSGTVTFLFTDIEGSTRLREEQPDTMSVELQRHDTIVREAIEANGGHVFETTGDGALGAFDDAASALRAAEPPPERRQRNANPIREALGPRFDEYAAQGASMSFDELVAWSLTALDRPCAP